MNWKGSLQWSAGFEQFVVQLQDIKSYLLSIAKGSPTEHAWLKMNQIRSNSFYKFFPKEIFQKELYNVKMNLLKQKGP